MAGKILQGSDRVEAKTATVERAHSDRARSGSKRDNPVAPHSSCRFSSQLHNLLRRLPQIVGYFEL